MKTKLTNPFHNRPHEADVINPLVGESMLELGNKFNGKLLYKTYFEPRFRHVSVDINGRDGALPLDLTEPLNLGTFDMVTNFGTTEHVGKTLADQERCWHNILEAMHVGSVFVSTTPAIGFWPKHGRWYPTEKFYQQLADDNGLRVEKLYMANGTIHTRMVRESVPSTHTIPINHIEENISAMGEDWEHQKK